MGGAQGSKILITTCYQYVTDPTSTSPSYCLEALPIESSFELLMRMACQEEGETGNPIKVDIGRQIVKMCDGIPLVIRMIRSLFFSKRNETEWFHFEREISECSSNRSDDSKITKLPDVIRELVKLRLLSLRNCRCIRELPESTGRLGSSLEELDIWGTSVSQLPDSFGNFQGLRVLKMDYYFPREFPNFIGRLLSLEEMHASLCRSLKGEIPGDIGKLIHLRILRLQYSGFLQPTF
ncbi:hypothetical protein EUGRSUZ_E02647 [Eucalyptus grandis]|uniref:Disease resistance R13L4/SHOC-2-like LRR domain-containing protein n=2 Tax=Eucalyptus grandis TaxID=71139 RepID=A0A059C7W2_EUCGR|nr:hypothetical protein EUGRSUZ_E02647 [Eucalyptus grandis]